MKLTAEMMKKIAGCGNISTGDLEEMLDDARREEALMARGIQTPKITQREKNGVVQFYTVVPARFSRDRKRHQVVCKTEEECKRKVQKIIIAAVEEKKTRTVSKLVEEYLAVKKGSVKPQSFSGYCGNYEKHIKKSAFGQLDIERVQLPDCQMFINSLYSKNLSYSTIRKLKMMISEAFEYGISRDYILRNYAKYITINKSLCTSSRTHEAGAWTDDEVKQLWDASMKLWNGHSRWYRNSALIMVMIFTGCRAGEISAATWDDVDFEKRTLSITKTHTQYTDYETGTYIIGNSNTKTEESTRIISLNDAALFWLNEIKRRNSSLLNANSNRIAVTAKGGAVSPATIDIQMKRFCEAAGVRYMPSHANRKTYATMMIDSGLPVSEVAADLGHTDITTTQNIYYKRRSKPDEIKARKNDAVLATVGNRLKNPQTRIKSAF